MVGKFFRDQINGLNVKYLLFFAVLLSCSLSCVAERYYVSNNGTAAAKGSSWANPTSLDGALHAAIAGDEVWVAQGVYRPATTTDRNVSFTIAPGVKVYGGFNGTETNIQERPAGKQTTLCGDIGKEGYEADNVFTVVTMLAGGAQFSTLDGFQIQNGTSRNFKEGFGNGSAGGGLFIAAGEPLANHQILNCSFLNNKAHNGGAVLVAAGRPSFVNCSFKNNSADFNGGAVYNKGIATVASPIFRDCIFEDNNSNSGAGMTNNGSNGNSSPLLLGCSFINNVSLMNGAAIYNISNDSGETEPVLENCSFVGNDSILGDDVTGDIVSKSIDEKARANGGGSLTPTVRR